MTPASISVTVRFFASAKDLAQMPETTLSLPRASVAEDVLTHLVRSFPAMNELRKYIRIAVNESYVDGTFELHEGDEVAIIPPVSGG